MTAFIYHPDFKRHDTGDCHPETMTRAKAVADFIESSDLSGVITWIRPDPIEARWIDSAHTSAYRRFVEEACLSGRTVIDGGDTHICDDSFRVAQLSAGAALAAVDAVLDGTAGSAFACARPPGHHAGQNKAMGFCLFNNVAIAARYAQRHFQVGRVLIVDWDVHHGNGTQDLFYEDDSVLFFSAHQYPFYPGTGGDFEEGRGRGKGHTVNAPMRAGAGLAEYKEAFREKLRPAADAFKPDLVLISAGFDAHRDDPLGGIQLDENEFAELTRDVLAIANDHCAGRVVSLLEGGYNLGALARSAHAHIQALGE